MNNRYDFSAEIKFTNTYIKYKEEHIAIREARCMQQMYPDVLCKIEKNYKFAGRLKYSNIFFASQSGGLGYNCNKNEIEKLLKNNEYDPDFIEVINGLLEFWKTENCNYKVRAAYPDHLVEALPTDNWTGEPVVGACLYRMSGTYLDHDKLLCNGIPGLKNLINNRKNKAMTLGEDVNIFVGMDMALDILSQSCIYYRDMTIQLAQVEEDNKRAKELREMATVLDNISSKAPSTLREAMQLSWIYQIISDCHNYGRMDVALGDFLARDLEASLITMDEAQELFNSFWQLIADRKSIWNGRVILGGKGRRNEKNADRVAIIAMEATRVVKEIEPQLTLRFYKGMNEVLMEKALSVIEVGRTYPMLYNDDINVPAVTKAFNITPVEAEQYVAFGCGEYVIEHRSVGTPNGIINCLKALEITLRNGKDGLTGKQLGPQTGDLDDFVNFEQLYEAYKKQIEYSINALAEQEVIEYKVAAETASYLFLSILFDDCIERGKGMYDGGVRYLGGTVESYGNTNTADSLTAIKDIVYDKKLLTKQQLLTILEADFEGYEKEHMLLKDAPKYGNDDDAADEMAVRNHEFICNLVRNQINRVKLHSYLVVIINNSANTTLGGNTAASADGRLKGQYMANANNPTGGNDKNGLTAMLNSLVKLKPEIHAGAVQNMMFSPELFKNNGVIIKSLLKSYFQNGGTQAMISVVNKNDLQKAMLEPENYSNLFVRVGGFSARFVTLAREVQLEILSRTHY